MKPNPSFIELPKRFWANVRTISEKAGYTERRTGAVKIPTTAEVQKAFTSLGLSSSHLFSASGDRTELGQRIHDYFVYRASILNTTVRSNLMRVDEAALEFAEMKKRLNPSCPLPMNKQKGDKKANAYLTGMVNMTIEASLGGLSCCYDPMVLTSFTQNGEPIRTLARRVDGAFPGTVNPIAIWEIKEYYYTTTFGSRIADGVYESLLDGMELEELAVNEQITAKHYLFVDAYYTWWDMGRSYLCRIIDMLHMGYLDEVLFGRQVITELPSIVEEWKALHSRSVNP